MIRHTLSANVKRLRVAAGLTQAQLGERSGTSRGTIAVIEGATSAASVDTLEALAKALNTTPSALLEPVMLKPYTISNTSSGHTFGVYHGTDELDAYRALCEDARAERPDEIPDEILVEEGDAEATKWIVEYVTAWANERGHSPRHEWELGLSASEDDIKMLLKTEPMTWDRIEASWDQAGETFNE